MTLEEKVGQIANIAVDQYVPSGGEELNLTELEKGILTYKIGSFQNTYNGEPHSKEHWASFQKTFSEISRQTRLQIPIVYGLDSNHGANFVTNATLFPHQISVAASFNREISRISGEVSAYETRAASVAWTFSPVQDLGIDPRWSRIYEDFGEDPYVSSEMGAAMIKGFQGENPNEIDEFHVAACAKHYLGYSNPFSGKDRTPAIISENYLREYHLPSFEAAIKAGVATVMVNSGLINGIPVHSSRYLITDVLKNELGFDGVVISDWQDIENIFIRDHVAASSKEAVKLGINAGLDMSIVPYNYDFCENLIQLVNEGEVSEERINDALRRILRFKAKLNLWDIPLTDPANYPKFGSTELANHSYVAAIESITLLKNNNKILP